MEPQLSPPFETSADGPPVTLIKPSNEWLSLRLHDLWEYRELMYFLIWRDVKVRYKQTVLGSAWAILQPVLTMTVFSVLFGRLAKVPSDNIPYPIFAYAALLPWQLFSQAVTSSANSLVASEQLITKVYFPRLIIPIASVLAGLVDFAIAFLVLLGMMFYYKMLPTAAALVLPLFLLMALATALAVGLWLSALNVQYRDVRHTLPFLTQFWLLITPIAYSSSLIPKQWLTLYALNPMVGVVEGFRWALLGNARGMQPIMLVSALMVIALLLGGLVYFRRSERTFADVV
jgi:lipopolysaccharide transport system permease protein